MNYNLYSIFFRYNDENIVYDKDIYTKLINANIDHQMAQHVAHLFIRDTVSLFSEKVHQDDTVEMDHFEVNKQVYFFKLILYWMSQI